MRLPQRGCFRRKLLNRLDRVEQCRQGQGWRVGQAGERGSRPPPCCPCRPWTPGRPLPRDQQHRRKHELLGEAQMAQHLDCCRRSDFFFLSLILTFSYVNLLVDTGPFTDTLGRPTQTCERTALCSLAFRNPAP